MFNIANYFKEGIKKTLLVTNNGATSHNGPWKQAYTNTQVERWHAGEFSSAEFTISIDYNNANKEIVKCIVAVGVDYANLSLVGRSNLGNDLVDLSVTVNQSYVDELKHFITCFKENKKNKASLEEGIHTMKLILAAEKSELSKKEELI